MSKKTVFFITIVLLFNFICNTQLNASVVKGKKYYIQLLKKPCGFNGNIMGKKHTIHEWQKLYHNGQLGVELKRICPKAPLITSKKKLKHLSYFLKYFAKDSGNIPSCGD